MGHKFDPGHTGMSVECNQLVVRDGDTDECGLPREAHAAEPCCDPNEPTIVRSWTWEADGFRRRCYEWSDGTFSNIAVLVEKPNPNPEPLGEGWTEIGYTTEEGLSVFIKPVKGDL